MLESFEIEGGILRRYRGDEAHVVIPAGVTRIGESAFEGCETLASVDIPGSVTEIGGEVHRARATARTRAPAQT